MRIKRLLKVSNSSVYKTSGPIRAPFISHNEKRLSTKHLVNATIWHFQEILQRHIQFKFDNEQLAEVFMRPEDLQYSKKNFEVALKLFVYFMQRTETRLQIRNGW